MRRPRPGGGPRGPIVFLGAPSGFRKRLWWGFATLLSLSFGLSLAQAPVAGGGALRSWQTAPRHSAGIAPAPAALADTPIVQVYAASTFGWRGVFAEHPWIIYKRAGDTVYTRYDVVGWRAPNVVQRNYAIPDGLWYGAQPKLLVDQRGEGVDALIAEIETAIASYPYAQPYRRYPGPNSNTFPPPHGRAGGRLRGRRGHARRHDRRGRAAAGAPAGGGRGRAGPPGGPAPPQHAEHGLRERLGGGGIRGPRPPPCPFACCRSGAPCQNSPSRDGTI